MQEDENEVKGWDEAKENVAADKLMRKLRCLKVIGRVAGLRVVSERGIQYK